MSKLRHRLLAVAVLLAALPSALRADVGVRFVARDLMALEPVGAGYVAAAPSGAILRAADGNLSFASVFGGDFAEPAHSIAASGSVVVAVGGGGVILRSANSGQTWADITPLAIIGDWNGVATNGAGTWVAVGFDGFSAAVVRSTDNGATWASVSTGVEGTLTGVAYDAGSQVWLAVGRNGLSSLTGLVLRSTNQGASWQQVPMGDETRRVEAVAADGAGTFLLVGQDGLIASAGATGGLSVIAPHAISQSLFAVSPTWNSQWIIGGADSFVGQVTLPAGTVMTVSEPVAGSGTVTALVHQAGDWFLASGDLEPAAFGVPALQSTGISGGVLHLRLESPLLGGQYRLLTSSNQSEWTVVTGSLTVAGPGPIDWSVAIPASAAAFWRAELVVE